MDFIANQAAERLVNELVASQRAFALEFRGHDEGRKVRIVVALNGDDCVAESGFDQGGDFYWVHVEVPLSIMRANCDGPRSVPRIFPGSQCAGSIVYDNEPVSMRGEIQLEVVRLFDDTFLKNNL